MGLIRAPETSTIWQPRMASPFMACMNGIALHGNHEKGIALFMVLAAVSVLSIIVTEFTYITQMNQKLAFDSTDQLKAHYLAKSGLKLSLLRLKKAYPAGRKTPDGRRTDGAAAGEERRPPRAMLDKIWSFPFFMYPIPPSNIPGLSMTDKGLRSKSSRNPRAWKEISRRSSEIGVLAGATIST